MGKYFTDVDDGAYALIHNCIEPLDENVRVDYLVNVLMLKCNQDKTIKEIFQAELKAKEDFEEGIS